MCGVCGDGFGFEFGCFQAGRRGGVGEDRGKLGLAVLNASRMDEWISYMM